MAEIARLFPDLDPRGDRAAPAFTEAVRIAEALLFSAIEPLPEAEIAKCLPDPTAIGAVLAKLRADYATRGVVLTRVGTKWIFRTADDLGWLLSPSARAVKKLSRAALETLAIIAYHQPTTRAEIEDIRGVAISKGTLDVLLETGWVKLRGRRRVPGRPITYGTTDAFLLHFGLECLADLPGLDELRGAGLFEGRLPAGFSVPHPRDGALADDEDPIERADAGRDDEPDLQGADLQEADLPGSDLPGADLHGPEEDEPDASLDEPDMLERDPFA